jgi:hypothetical protein
MLFSAGLLADHLIADKWFSSNNVVQGFSGVYVPKMI